VRRDEHPAEPDPESAAHAHTSADGPANGRAFWDTVAVALTEPNGITVAVAIADCVAEPEPEPEPDAVTDTITDAITDAVTDAVSVAHAYAHPNPDAVSVAVAD
jgi:hypothetical protein